LNLDIEYAFYRNSLSCLIEKYDDLNRNYFFQNTKNKEEAEKAKYNYQQLKIQNLITTFIMFKYSFEFRGCIQNTILGINSFTVLVNVMTILYKFIFHFKDNRINKVFSFEIYLSFFLDVIVAILGGFSYFILDSYINFLTDIVESGCVDNYVQYKFGVFSASLDGTSTQNLQIFLVMIIKIFIIVVYILYFLCANEGKSKCKDISKIIKENINEGETDNDDSELKKMLKKASKNSSRGMLKIKNTRTYRKNSSRYISYSRQFPSGIQSLKFLNDKEESLRVKEEDKCIDVGLKSESELKDKHSLNSKDSKKIKNIKKRRNSNSHLDSKNRAVQLEDIILDKKVPTNSDIQNKSSFIEPEADIELQELPKNLKN